MKKLLILFFLCIGCKAPVQSIDTLFGTVAAVADGDTFTLTTENMQKIKVRLYAIDAPEKKQDFGRESRNRLVELVADKKVKIEIKGVDRYKRSLAVVYIGKTDINAEMIKGGYAWHFKRYDKSQAYADLEIKARQAQRGLWSRPDPIAPWVFRKTKH